MESEAEPINVKRGAWILQLRSAAFDLNGSVAVLA
jgi:hypothetical protein